MKEKEEEKKMQEEQQQAETQATEQNNEHTEQQEQAEMTDAEKLAAANEEIAQLKDKYLRQVAEFDNYRKRTLKEKTELILNGVRHPTPFRHHSELVQSFL